ncbi:hypothetical protein Aros01_07267 [Streptosporangium roseum]|uniref:Uncharacterized protein n=1 Tax=Streptosporangium roseum (strain ATCC 12428 / DSM 43021 / JCM 3005 / KCTC 9067 / NCIMB 10171 / NRRL 2505 / NI 9100) TaxID=479432 RepID=D2AU82_STRRD|nr:hypothetical protein Sros_7876 [Streptosporangium roseum DSM 43021]
MGVDGLVEGGGRGVTRNREEVVGRGVRRTVVGCGGAEVLVISGAGVGLADLVGSALVAAGVGRTESFPGQPTTDSGVPVNSPPTTVATAASISVPTTTPAIFRNRLRLPV